MNKVMLGLSALALLAGTATTATADSGDGSLACNTYEICFSRDTGNTTNQKHFYYSAKHDAYKFTNVNTGASAGCSRTTRPRCATATGPATSR